MIWLMLLFLFVVWSVYIGVRGRKIQAVARQIHRVDKRWWPLVGHSYVFIGDNECLMNGFCFLARDAIKKGGMTSYWNMGKFVVVVADPEIAEFLFKNCLEKDEQLLRAARTVTGNGSIFAPEQDISRNLKTKRILLLLRLMFQLMALRYKTNSYLITVNIWRPRRKILAPTFSMKNLNRFVDVFAEQSSVLMDQLAPKVGVGDFSVWSNVNNYSFDAVCETTLGIQAQCQQKTSTFLVAVEEVFRLTGERACKAWMYNEVIYRMLPHYKQFYKSRQLVYDFVDKIVKSKRLELAKRGASTQANDGFKVPSVVEMLIESSGSDGYTDLELREEVVVLLLAGTDTSAVGISFTIVMLSRHQEVQQKVLEELKEVFGDSDRLPTAEDLPKLKYLEAVIKETLRLYPPVPVTAREVHEDIKLPSGTTLVKDVTIMFSHWGVHHNPRYWGDDVEEFRPERFLEGSLKHPAQFIPFSYGLRNCLGYQYAMMSMKTVVTSFVRRYRILPPVDLDPRQLKAPLRVKYVIDMKHVDDYVVRIEKRNS